MRDPIIDFTDHCMTFVMAVMAVFLVLALLADMGKAHERRCRWTEDAGECQPVQAEVFP